MERIEKIASDGKVLKLQSEDNVQYARKINATPEQAEQWIEVDESEYLDWQAEQEKLAENVGL